MEYWEKEALLWMEMVRTPKDKPCPLCFSRAQEARKSPELHPEGWYCQSHISIEEQPSSLPSSLVPQSDK